MTKDLTSNALANVAQVLASGGLLFALYRYINTTLGVEQLGVWSVVLAAVSASRLVDLGLSPGVTRFVARDLAQNNPDRVGQVIDTVTLTLMIALGGILPLFYPLLVWLLPHLLKAEHLAQALALLPYALASLWLTMVAAVFQGGLDGCQRMGLRATVVVTGHALLLALAVWLVPQHGLVGLAWAQLGQGLFVLVVSWLVLRRALPVITWLPRRWCWGVLREMLGYGLNVQAATVFMLIFDPLAKALMARFGGPAAAGYFEMASQVVMRIRSLIVTANQAIVPHVAAFTEGETAQLANFYRTNMRVLIYVVLPTFALVVAWGGGFSLLLTGGYEPEFVFLLNLLATAWAFNIFAGPAYFTNMGIGQVGWNTLSHIIIGVLNAGLGWLLGNQFGANGVAIAYAIALVTGSTFLIVVSHRRNGVGWCGILSRDNLWLAAACAVVGALGWIVQLQPRAGSTVTLAAAYLLPALVLGLAVWFHPMRHQLRSWLLRGEVRA